MASRRPRAGRADGAPRAHVGEDGFTWSVRYPERSASLGARKPLARIVMGTSGPADAAGTESASGEELAVPVAVARALEASDAPEPTCRAELLFRTRETADSCAWARVVDMASRREHSFAEVVERLRGDGYSEACAERAAARGRDARVIDDRRFADSFVRAKLASGWGQIRIERELSRRGIVPSELAGWPDAYFGDASPEERARELLERRRVPERNAYPKLVRFLASRGYPLSVAKDAVSEHLSSLEEGL